MKNKEQLLAIHAQLAKLNKQIDKIQDEISISHRAFGAALIIIIVLQVIACFTL